MTDAELVEACAIAIMECGAQDWANLNEATRDSCRIDAQAALSVARPIIEQELLEAMMKDAKLLQILNVQRFLNQHARERGIEIGE